MAAQAETNIEAKTTPEALKNGRRDESLLLRVIAVFLVVVLIVIRVYCGLHMIIADCDETYNYWEPLHFLFRGFGKETWEYSPNYAIRSYLYLLPYYIITFPLRDFEHLTGIAFPAYYYFYFIRLVALGGVTAAGEFALFKSIKSSYGLSSANWFLLISATSAGMSHASIALLPSSYAMTCILWATSYALDAIKAPNTLECVKPSVLAIALYLSGGLIGWPFALVLGLAFGLYTISHRQQTTPLIHIVMWCHVVVVVLVGTLLMVDSFFYQRTMLFVPANIVLYNVFALEGEGPLIFGVEPFSYYVKNMVLNFNIAFPLSAFGVVINLFLGNPTQTTIAVSIPLGIWLIIFFSQPHKEERFLYPVYPLVSLSAAIFISGSISQALKRVKSGFMKGLAIFLLGLVISLLSISRILSLVNNYHAPLSTATIFEKTDLHLSKDIVNICIGREWYRFPTSFFLPKNARLKFVKSGFDGLLPGDFQEDTEVWKASSSILKHMNSRNIFSDETIVDFAKCDFYIDTTLPVNPEIPEPDARAGSASNEWKTITCAKMLSQDEDQRGFARVLYIPERLRQFLPSEVHYTDYCVYQRGSEK